MKVLLLMSDTGGGHRAAAQAIAAALKRLSPTCEVEVVDAVAEISPGWNAVVRLYGPIVRTVPWLWALLYAVFRGLGRATAWKLTAAFVTWTVRHSLIPFLDRKQPDVVCSTHPLINQVCQFGQRQYLAARGKRIPLAVVVTDPVTFHPAWIEPGADLTVVATEEARTEAVRCGAALDRLHLLGLPIHPDFFAPEGTEDARAASRRTLGLPSDGPVVLCTGGGEGLGGFTAAVTAILHLPQAPHVLAVAGRDSAVHGELLNLAAREPRLMAFGFTDQMPTLMRASDVVVTKAGPGTLFEAMALGRPLVLVGAVPGQERGNVELVRRHGVGLVALEGPEAVGGAVGQLLDQPEERERMGRQGMELSRPDAALQMARQLLALGGEVNLALQTTRTGSGGG